MLFEYIYLMWHSQCKSHLKWQNWKQHSADLVLIDMNAAFEVERQILLPRLELCVDSESAVLNWIHISQRLFTFIFGHTLQQWPHKVVGSLKAPF